MVNDLVLRPSASSFPLFFSLSLSLPPFLISLFPFPSYPSFSFLLIFLSYFKGAFFLDASCPSDMKCYLHHDFVHSWSAVPSALLLLVSSKLNLIIMFQLLGSGAVGDYDLYKGERGGWDVLRKRS